MVHFHFPLTTVKMGYFIQKREDVACEKKDLIFTIVFLIVFICLICMLLFKHWLYHQMFPCKHTNTKTWLQLPPAMYRHNSYCNSVYQRRGERERERVREFTFFWEFFCFCKLLKNFRNFWKHLKSYIQNRLVGGLPEWEAGLEKKHE